VRVLLTGTGQEELAEALRNEGFDIEQRPLVRVEPLEGPAVRAEGYDWLVLTSRNGVEALFGRLEGRLPRVAVVGPGTAEALRRHGVDPSFVSGESTQEGLVAGLPSPVGRVLFAGAEGARDVLLRGLEADFVALYRTVELAPNDLPEADLVVVASGSAARAVARVRPGARCVSIGPVTSAEARRLGLTVVAEAAKHDREGLVEAVKLAASRRDSSPS
jgi:uroporphyrinogen III methyltransferase/synthase